MNGLGLKLISLNIESKKHWERILPFLDEEKPGVLCLQEILLPDVEMLENRYGYKSVYLPITLKNIDGKLVQFGVGIFTALPIKKTTTYYYEGEPSKLPVFSNETTQKQQNTVLQGLAGVKIEKDEKEIEVLCAHFTWTPKGDMDSKQEKDIEHLMEFLKGMPELILCGDFNVPRGYNQIYDKLTERFKDNIPNSIQSTLDTDFHRAKTDPVEKARISKFVVDYIFSTPGYLVNNVGVKCGLSDHCAIVADVYTT